MGVEVEFEVSLLSLFWRRDCPRCGGSHPTPYVRIRYGFLELYQGGWQPSWVRVEKL